MSELVFASQMMREVIAPPCAAGSKGERIRAASRRLQWKHSRALTVWYADERVSLKPHELRKIEEITGVKYGQKEVNEVDHLIARADALLGSHGEGFRGALVAALRQAIGTVDRPGTEG